MAQNYALKDCVAWLSEHALHRQDLFTSAGVPDCTRLLSLRRSYDKGSRTLRRHENGMDAMTVANFLLLWLSSLPEPLFGKDAREKLLADVGPEQPSPRATTLREVLDSLSPREMGRVFTLFEFLHHHWVNQDDRARSLQQMAFLFGPMLFNTTGAAGMSGGDSAVDGDVAVDGTPRPRPAATEEEVTLAGATAFLISNFRALFMQPSSLERWREDGLDDVPERPFEEPEQDGAQAEAVASEASQRTSEYSPEAASACILAHALAPPSSPSHRFPLLTCCSSCSEDEELGRCLDSLLGQLIAEYVAPGSGAKLQPGSPTDVLVVGGCGGPAEGDDPLERLLSGSTSGECKVVGDDDDADDVSTPVPGSPASPTNRWINLRVRTVPL